MPVTIGNTSISGLGVGGLPAGSVTADTLENSSVTRAKIGYSGAVLQTVAANNTTRSTHTNTNTNVVSVTITPTSSTSKIFIHSNCWFMHDNGNGYFTILRNGSAVGYAVKDPVNDDRPGGDTYASGTYYDYEIEHSTINVLDSPGTTSAVTYTLRYQHVVQNGGTLYVNRGRQDDVGAVTSIMAMEIKG